ncbi:protein-glutamate O-methyltransferase CheR [Desulfuromonas sp.]|uniref:CheR family methyltransferase n=1 Tax=Desulfuromonas sp. TaxID=892 RepID=UPI0025B8530D|nr:protein-glutamate O-methyltransferase CheR [Desulfuromonas sp.]
MNTASPLSPSAPATSGGPLMPISDREFQLLRDLIYERFGINLTDQKRSLLVSRLQKILRGTGFGSFQDYYEYLVKTQDRKAFSQLIDLVSTNHTYFNREKAHFDYFLKTALPAVVEQLKKENRRDLRIWCAGCSSGEEAYMLLMLMFEFFGSEYSQWDAGLLATDISERILATAQAGIYPEERVSQLPEQMKRKYFRRLADGTWQAGDRLKQEATFRRLNLMNERFPFKKPFQIIFCRNVMIYFDGPTREALVKRFHQSTDPGGYLFIGHSETLGRDQSLYRYLMPAAYRKEGF